MADPLTSGLGKLRSMARRPTLRPREPVSIYEDEARALLAERDRWLDAVEALDELWRVVHPTRSGGNPREPLCCGARIFDDDLAARIEVILAAAVGGQCEPGCGIGCACGDYGGVPNASTATESAAPAIRPA